ncbi:cytochrome c biogenesis protein CcsA [Puniceicoccales bacterium CK1056]|uniref:Cytochrome c biogenesis protein CcsA n=1 Tax=Oceanipulchritudo coccoides TaxID=2706888 RepID=A0A6B2M5B9_9BACT|nr:cytochrome c biogenesis protein CcsA [Oceanipulchritudo coccoides]NDV63314.1 cytochrome c biogenesis protein CcsA [Oceanipulchritudo coccoides]
MSLLSTLKTVRGWVILGIFILAGLFFLKDVRSPSYPDNWELGRLAALPVQEGGRIKPVDTIARTSLMMIAGKQTYRDANGSKHDAIEWFAELILNPQSAANRQVFRIDHPDLVGLLGFHNEERKYFSLAEISPHFDSLREQFANVPEESHQQTTFDKALIKLQNSIGLYDRVAYIFVPPPFFGNAQGTYQMIDRVFQDRASAEPGSEQFETVNNALRLFAGQFSQLAQGAHVQAIPPAVDNLAGEWESLGGSLLTTIQSGAIDPVVEGWAELSVAFQNSDPFRFSAALDKLESLYDSRTDERAAKTDFETFFNNFAPFYYSMELYVLIFIVAAFSWMGWSKPLAKTAFWLLMAAFLVHTFGMVARIYIQARPPVTNLYSSAIFVSWAAIPLCLYLERRALNGIAAAAAALLGFSTLIIAHHLSFSGDTMEMMRAVLDSNFWLATHVPTVTLGYSATFLAGLIAFLYIVRSTLFGGVDKETEKLANGMVYGSVCFALLFSFVGTVLGGIWADQSWGRFWGWDPKENGALMIVLWNAVVLHARWGKAASTMGIMQLAIVGNIITAWSWFGTNMLGVGLHSYGFMDAAFLWLMIFILSQVLVILLGYKKT